MTDERNVETGRTGGSWAVTILSGVLGVVFLGLGGAKLAAPSMMVEQFQTWGYPAWFIYVVGGLEVLGGLLLIVPASRVIGAITLILVMIGAAGTHILAGEWASAIVPVVILLALVWITRRMAWLYQSDDLAAHEGVHAAS